MGRRRVGMAIAAMLVGLALAGAAQAGCPEARDMPAVASAFAERLNSSRARAGLAPLSPSPRLAQAAQDHACDMARGGFLAHRGSDGTSLRERMLRRAYRPCFGAENIARGQDGVDEVMAAWTGSAPHRANLLERRVREFGLGLAFSAGGGRPHWVLVLAAPC
jgi:uncharacterized protein YkwD